MKKMCYLSGMMDGVSYEEGIQWRLEATQFFKDHNWETYNPYVGFEKGCEKPTTNEVHHKDIYFLNKSDVVLVNLMLPEFIKNKDIPFFTIGELYLAHREMKPIVSYTNCLTHRAGYQQVITKTLPDLNQCLDYIITHF